MTEPEADWGGRRVLVAGVDQHAFAAADALLERGADVTVLAGPAGPAVEPADRERVSILGVLGAELADADALAGSPDFVAGQRFELVVTGLSDAFDDWLPAQAEAAGIPVWSDAELAWRLRPDDAPPWLTVAGGTAATRRATTSMLEVMLLAEGLRATAVGGPDRPVLEALLHPEPFAVLAVELPVAELRHLRSASPRASVCLSVPEADLAGRDEVAAQAHLRALGRVYAETQVACVYNVEDSRTEDLVREADVVEGARAVGFTLGTPAVSMLGLVEDILCDRAFVAEQRTSAAELATLDDLSLADGSPPPPERVAAALAACALARAHGVTPAAVREGLRAWAGHPH